MSRIGARLDSGHGGYDRAAYRAAQDEVHRRLAYDLDRFWEENDLAIARLRQGVQIAAAGLMLEVLALVALVADTVT